MTWSRWWPFGRCGADRKPCSISSMCFLSLSPLSLLHFAGAHICVLGLCLAGWLAGWVQAELRAGIANCEAREEGLADQLEEEVRDPRIENCQPPPNPQQHCRLD
eukprot:SAG22_NODE_9752_length_571_cov_1.574153_2_plen_104_part_01